MWQTPITDRTQNDTLTARAEQSTISENKGALNYQDLNRIEGNHKELIQWLAQNGYYVPHTYRDFLESFNSTRYTDWQELNIPWLSEINRIRDNYNYIIRDYLTGLGLSYLTKGNYLMWAEVNTWESLALLCKETIENMQKEFIYCGTVNCGGDILL